MSFLPAEPGGAGQEARGAQGPAVPRAEVPEAQARAADGPAGPARAQRAARPEHERARYVVLRRRGHALEAAKRLRVLGRHGLLHQLHGQLQELRQVCGQSIRLGVR